MDIVRENLAAITSRIENAAHRVHRDPQEITLVAVSKKIGLERIQAAMDCGQLQFGENYIQEARDKIPNLAGNLSWHFIGHLQTNKAGMAAALFDVIETVDSLKLAIALNKHLTALQKILPVLIQVNIGGEHQKSGLPLAEAESLLREIQKLPMLRPTGLMAMPPFGTDPEKARPFFKRLREAAGLLAAKNLFVPQSRGPELSMGMSGDFEVAIEEGATIIRIGTALFGRRH
jgi:pyridoxal phosphate enzyme (YggS family)